MSAQSTREDTALGRTHGVALRITKSATQKPDSVVIGRIKAMYGDVEISAHMVEYL